MVTNTAEKIDFEAQISQLESEIATRQLDIKNLEEALSTLVAGKPRPADPSTDNAFQLLKELVGAAPQKLEEQQIYEAKLEAAHSSLQLAVEACQYKQRELDTLQQQKREQQADQLFGELVEKGDQFNAAVEEVVHLHSEMKALIQEISKLRGSRRFSTNNYADLSELPWAQISGDALTIRRRFDAIRDQK